MSLIEARNQGVGSGLATPVCRQGSRGKRSA